MGDTFIVSRATSSIHGMAFGAWLFPGDAAESAEVTLATETYGGTIYFDQVVNFTASGCAMNTVGFEIFTETGLFSRPTLNHGTYWLTLQNAVVNDGDPVYWAERRYPLSLTRVSLSNI